MNVTLPHVVRKLNEAFYDVEAAQYDARHPEVIEGDADWWSERLAALLGTLRAGRGPDAGVRLLDIGCGTGFVPGLAARHLAGGDLLVGIDQSAGMLARARAKLAGAERCQLMRADAAHLHFAAASFDLVTVNSFLHHVFDERAVLREIDRVLRPGGYLVLAHEPNRAFFRSPLVRWAAAAYKGVGLGMRVPDDIRDAVNVRLRAAGVAAAPVGGDEILRLVEFHSPLEQGVLTVDKDKGFALHDFLEGELRGYAVLEHTEYSTFFHRPVLARHPWLQGAVRGAARLLRGRGNLFSAVLRKGPEAACR